jgi:hypothetical protein
MTRKAKAAKAQYLFVPHEAILEAFGEKNTLTPDFELTDEYMFPLGDPILLALRESFTLTYPRRLDHIEPKQMLERIREVASQALKPLGDVLAQLKLPSAGKFVEEEGVATVFKLVIAPADKVTPRIAPEACMPADSVMIALREVLSLSFAEVYSDSDYAGVFAKVRNLAATTLIPYNEILEYLEIEPVAMPTILDPNQD